MTEREQLQLTGGGRKDALYINGKFLAQPVTGVQRYAIHILEKMDSLIADGYWTPLQPLVLLVPDRREITTPAYRYLQIYKVSAGNLHAWEQIRLPLAARGRMLLNLAGSAPLLKFGQICTFHDTAVFDYPSAYSPVFTRWYRLVFAVQGKLSRRLLTVSEFSKSRLVKHLGVRPEKIGVVNSAADHIRSQVGEESVLGKLGVTSGKYLLAVGSANPTKNFPRLIEAFAAMPDANAQLVVVGGSNSAVFADTAKVARDDPRIVRAGRLTDAELKSLYTHARAYVFPSVYEGFGLPPIEAMLCGCPVIAANAASIPEICGSAAAYFDPLSPESMREAMGRALRDDGWLNQLRVAGQVRAQCFSWHHAATGLLRQLEQLGLVREGPLSQPSCPHYSS